MGTIASRLRRDGMILLGISMAFATLAAVLLVVGRINASGWDSLDYLVYAMGVGVLWAVVVVGYLVWVVIRDGWQLSSLPAALVLAALVAVAAVWAYREHAVEAECQAAIAFYQDLADRPAGERAAAIADAGAFVLAPSDCAIDGFQLAFGRPNPTPDARPGLTDTERSAVLAQLLDAGLPPLHRLLYGLAVDDADPVGSRLLLQRRKHLNATAGTDWDLFPDSIVTPLMSRARVPANSPWKPREARYRAVLSAFVAEGLPDPSVLPPWMQEELTGLDLPKDR